MKKTTSAKLLSLLMVLCLLFTACGSGADGGDTNGADAGKPVYVYLTRHGQTLTNQTHRFVSGQGNTPLTEEGREVAYQLGVGLSGLKFEKAYSSTLGRTQETARLILAQSQTSGNLEIQPIHDLRECDGGFFEPMDYGSLAQEYGMKFDSTVVEFLNQFYEKDETGVAESYEEFRDRVMASFQSICEEASQTGGNLLMVAHGGVNNMIASEISKEEGLEALENSSIVLIEYKDGEYSVLSYNDLSYIEKAKAKMEDPEPVELYLTVHGETLVDQQGRLTGVLDSALTDAGKEQAQAIGKKLADKAFAAVYASDQFKDLDTAQLILSENSENTELIVNTDLAYRGVACGYFDGELRTVTDALAPAGSTAKERLAAYAAADKTGMTETYEKAEERLLGAVRALCQDTRKVGGGKVLMVTSELSCQLIGEALGGKVSAPLKPGTVFRIVYDGSNYTVEEQ